MLRLVALQDRVRYGNPQLTGAKLVAGKYVALSAFLLAFFTREAFALKTGGHEHVETAAYAALKDPTGRHRDGARILEDLVERYEVLRGIGLDPEVRNHNPDWALERQYALDRQCYHFMASNEEVEAALAQKAKNSKQALLENAFPGCMRLMRFLFVETVNNPPGSRQSGRGAYVLMHAVIDSYSSEHAPRDRDLRILTIKGWELNNAWGPEARVEEPRVTCNKHKPLLELLHTPLGDGDYDWKPCPAIPYDVGKAAANAVVDLLVAMHRALVAKNSAEPDAWKEQEIQRHWEDFVQAHLMPYGYEHPKAGGKLVSLTTGPDISLTASAHAKDVDSHLYNTWAVLHQKMGSDQATGIEWTRDFMPYTADAKWWVRAPIFVSASWVAAHEASSEDVSSRLDLRAGRSLNVRYKLFHTELRPSFGVGQTLGPGNQTSAVARLDLAWSSFDWNVGLPVSLRYGFGWAYDSAAYPARNTLSLFIGLNSWGTRAPFDNWKPVPSVNDREFDSPE
jgi:hypothetical protein